MAKQTKVTVIFIAGETQAKHVVDTAKILYGESSLVSMQYAYTV